MQVLYGRYADLGLEILAFPCNNFGAQEPGTNTEVLEGAKKKFSVTFPILGKLECENGDKTAPIFTFMKETGPGGFMSNALKWNFSKFLCDAEGRVVGRKGPQESPFSFENELQRMLIAAGADKEAVGAASLR